MEEQFKTIEVNGVKLDIDLRHCKVITNFKIGDTVKVLIKQYDSYKSYLGVIVGFDEFQNRPTIIIAYLEIEYSSANIKFAYINSETKDTEVCAINEWDIPYNKSTIIDRFNNEIIKKEEELRELNTKKNVFMQMFGKYFENINSKSETNTIF